MRVGPQRRLSTTRIDAFKLWCWRRLLRFPLTARRSNQSILKEINPEYSLEGLILKLKLLYFGRLIWRANSPEKSLMLGEIEGKRGRGRQRMDEVDGWHHWLNDMSLSRHREMVKDREAWWAAVHGVTKSQIQISNWTMTTYSLIYKYILSKYSVTGTLWTVLKTANGCHVQFSKS